MNEVFKKYLIFLEGGCNGVLCTSAVDTLISGLIIHATGQIKILKNNLNLLDKRADNYVSKLDEPSREIQKNRFIHEKLLHYADHYNDIIEFIKDMEDLFSLSISVQIVGSSVVICMMCYMLTLKEGCSTNPLLNPSWVSGIILLGKITGSKVIDRKSSEGKDSASQGLV
ncbi:hypothetical protein WA026_017760 [Henosepilachna vigintioctopunctata]|uniref:Uncharacterized protein n=1 Tax=Henosepilachna vigintioctopunctata TaxID=420089 RepID=A0AAW1U8E4_9CUCU